MNILVPNEIPHTNSPELAGHRFALKPAQNDAALEKPYYRIPHLPGSRMASDDRKAKAWQTRICCEQLRDKHDLIVVQEKLDGSCVAVLRSGGEIIPLLRSGNCAVTSRYEQHRVFHKWVFENLERFDGLLGENEICVGEWLMQAHGTRYKLRHEPFVLFDLKSTDGFLTCDALQKRVAPFNFTTPRIVHRGGPIAIENALKLLHPSGHGAIGLVEGAIWRVEREAKVDFLAKYVCPKKEIGCFLPERPGQRPVWNWRPA